MSGYTPVFGSIFTGTLCGKYPDTATWLFFLALADKNGVVDMTPQYISSVTGMPVEELVGCIERFEKPDPYSRSSQEDGRRLVRVDPTRSWGWRIVNHGKYRERARLLAKSEREVASGQNAARMGDRRRPPETAADPLSNTNANAYTNAIEEIGAPAGLDAESFSRWRAYRASIGKTLAPASVLAAQRKLAAFGKDQAVIVEHCIAQGWLGLYRPGDDKKEKRPFKPKTPEQLEAEEAARAGTG